MERKNVKEEQERKEREMRKRKYNVGTTNRETVKKRKETEKENCFTKEERNSK